MTMAEDWAEGGWWFDMVAVWHSDGSSLSLSLSVSSLWVQLYLLSMAILFLNDVFLIRTKTVDCTIYREGEREKSV